MIFGSLLKFLTPILNAIPWVGGVLESLLDKIIDSGLAKEHENRKTIFSGLESSFNTMMTVGRFRHLSIDETILSPVTSLDGELTEGILQDLVIKKWESGQHFIIIGDGGAGKTISLLNLCKQLYTSFDSYDCIPIYVSLSDYNYYTVDFNEPFLTSKILKMSGAQVDSRTLFQCLNKHSNKKRGTNNRPSTLLLLLL